MESFVICRASYGGLPENKDLPLERREYVLGGIVNSPVGCIDEMVPFIKKLGYTQIEIRDEFAHPDYPIYVKINEDGSYEVVE